MLNFLTYQINKDDTTLWRIYQHVMEMEKSCFINSTDISISVGFQLDSRTLL